MTFVDSVSTCLKKFTDFNGRASRSEYWWFALFFTLVLTASAFVHEWGVLIALAALILPLTAAAARRLHDTNRSGWFQLLNLVPLGNLYVLYLMVQEGTSVNNRY
ncbi:DUF805 domain-containing protein [Polaromonas sp. SM01]|jgi:uncharacterized membrane protein YhaH (DUF805 family)|uniref:DUF805 domain-containing protein n=1 Tax=Polaromonas sp. SM01 TaxID=3085630 RepID=UPI0029821D6D|nr:DUF805 domain-containing protein [Polaromonas sp. SM01]MDW5442823.1 DUF805 domain-containing protein [Polaromonas sp. SM01]